jgi:hypothetical protein
MADNNTTTTTTTDEFLPWFTSFYAQAWIVIIIVGLLCNTIGAVVVWTRRRVRRIATIQWLLALAIADNLFLIALAVPAVENWAYRAFLHVIDKARFGLYCKLQTVGWRTLRAQHVPSTYRTLHRHYPHG